MRIEHAPTGAIQLQADVYLDENEVASTLGQSQSKETKAAQVEAKTTQPEHHNIQQVTVQAP